ncbi:MAG: sugar transferase [Alphaproteobacteria bacterium]
MQRALKRPLDIVLSAAALIVLSPLLLLLAGLVWREFGRPVLFRQRRIGRGGEPFDVVKFRTMTQARDEAGDLKPDAERLTRFGLWMRALSLDELPEFVNVLRGEMSLIGPRPLLPEYLPYYSAEESRRHDVRPGISGWAQVNGRNNLGWDERLKMDLWYIEHWSLRLDLRIALRTVLVVLRRSDVQTDGHATFLRLDDHRREAAKKA